MADFTLQQLKLLKVKRFCEKDPVYFIENFVYTFDPRKEEPYIPFKLYDFQKDFILELKQAYELKYDMVIDKARDMGATWCVVAFMVWAWIFKKNFQGLVGSQKEEKVDKGGLPDTLFGKIDIILNRLPQFLMPKGWEAHKHRNHMRILNPSNGNTISGESSNPQFSRAGRYGMILLDEFAFWENSDAVWNATGDSSPCRIVLSTPNGLANTFADIRFSGNTKHFEFHWRLHPTKGIGAWFDPDQKIWRSEWYDKEVKRRLTSKDSSIKAIRQELDIDYIQTGDPVFPTESLLVRALEDKHPKRGENYAMGVDVSEGLEGSDNMSFTILAKSTGEQVLAWAGKLSIDDFSWKIMEVGAKYNQALIAVERNSVGVAVLNILKDKYRNLYCERKVTGRYDITTKNLGWHTTSSTKGMIISQLQAALTLGEIKITDKATYDELLVFQYVDTNSSMQAYSAPDGKKDDRVMALAIAWHVLGTVPFPYSPIELAERREKKERKKKLYDKILASSSCGY